MMTTRRNRYIAMFLGLALFGGVMMGGCQKQQASTINPSSQIQLLEPVGATATYEEVASRNLYKSRVYPANVYPYTVEYHFEVSGEVQSIAKLPGETVKKKTTLAKLNMDTLEKQIEEKEDYIQSMEESYEESKKALAEYIESKQADYDHYKWAKEAYENVKPAAFVCAPGYEQDPTQDPAYAQWKTEYDEWERQYKIWDGRFRILDDDISTRKRKFEQSTALYELDHAYQCKLLQDLKDQRSDHIITSGMKGKVVSINLLMDSNHLSSEKAMVAVGDESRKILKCEYITKTLISKAVDLYALIDGVRYEVKHKEIDAQEYTELTAKGETVYSTFEIIDAPDKIQMGDFGVIVLIEKRAEDVLSISKNAVHKNEYGNFVYVLNEEGKREERTVEVGMNDGVFTEIVSGLSLGDQVLVTEARKVGSKTHVLSKGMSSNTFDGFGYIFYPSSNLEVNPVKYGTTYLTEILVKQYQEVKKGDVIATVRVVKDEVELARQEQKLLRLKERLADIDATKEENAKLIEQRQEAIAELEELIADMKSDSQVKKIKATKSGIAIWVSSHKTEDILYYEEELVEIADADSCYVIVENTNQLLNYGDEVTITYTGLDGQTGTTSSVVSNLSKMGVSSALATDYSLLLIPEENAQNLAATQAGAGNWWSRTRFNASAVIRRMENVVLVPKKAVWLSEGNTYVNVMGKDGKVYATSFVAGGFNDEYYWVIEGLTEGMNVCLE